MRNRFADIMALLAVVIMVIAFCWGNKTATPYQPNTDFTNTGAKCYFGTCDSTNCINIQNGISCSTSGTGNRCYRNSPCRGIILCK